MPPPSDTNRAARIEARIAPEVLAVVKRAAEIEGRSVSDFVVAAACAAAERTIEEAQIIRLSQADQERIAAVLSVSPKSSDALDQAIAAHKALISSSR